MKLRTLVGSMVALGLVSTVAHAAPRNNQSNDMNDLNKRIKALEEVINRNQDNAAGANPASILDNDWYKMFTISGEVNPVFSWKNNSINVDNARDNPTGSSNSTTSSAAYLKTAEIYVDAQVNDFTKVHTALDYDYDWTSFSSSQALIFSEADIQFANLAKSGLYSVVGKQFFNFGSYQHDSITSTFTEMLAKTNDTGATFGYVSNNGFNASAYLTQGLLGGRSTAAQTGSTLDPGKLRTWGASLGYAMNSSTFGLTAQVDYLNNIAQTIFIANAIADNNTGTNAQTFYEATPGMSAHVGLSSGPFGLLFDYVTALKKFNPNDLQTGLNGQGAKPNATFTQLDYQFQAFNHPSTAYLAYETSAQADEVYGSTLGGFLMPKTREAVGYKYWLYRNTSVNAEFDHDKDYSINQGGSGQQTNGIMFGVDVKF